MANMIARLGVVLGLDTAEFNKGIEAAGKKLEQFSQSAEKFGKVGATALVAASAAALSYADDLADVAKANEVAIGTILKLSNALGNAGGKATDSGKLLASFTNFIDEAAGGSDKAQKTAKMLGVSLQDLGRLSEEELLNKVVKNLGSMDDSVTRNAKAMEVFGKAAKGVDFVSLAADMAKANKITKEQEKAIQDAADTYDLLAQNSRETMLVIATQLGPILKTSIEYLKDLTGETNNLGQVFKTVFQTIAITAADVGLVLQGLVDQFKTTVAIFNSLNPSTPDSETTDVFLKNEIKGIIARQNRDAFYAKIMGESQYGNSIDALLNKGNKPTSTAGGRKVSESKEAEKERLKTMRFIFEEAKKYDKFRTEQEAKEVAAYTNASKKVDKEEENLKIQEQLAFIDSAMLGSRAEDIKLTKDLYLNEQKRLENIREINQNNLLSVTAKDDLINRENQLANATERYLNAQNESLKYQRQGSFEEGFTRQISRFIRDMPTELEQGAKAFDSLMGNMESAIDKFVRTGKIGFKDLARSIIQDMIAIQMKAAASNLLSSLFGGVGRITAAPSNGMFGGSVMGMPGYADGGSPAVNSPSIVGERGPELFVPRTAGTIIPNHALAGVGGTTMVTNNYINAIDTKSFEQRLLGSPNAIWAANQYATKSLAVSRGRT
ncbi:Bacteriophage lambda, GpH, tail tape measure, C-terminal [uncultured Caudovirales phage]|uniref:Bacteriophage lambda, GpH, tail tape measure, C-terminal n=1 Tax=uncultured Caudovirales phage TaxID=2100421 RepID=A0A6J7WDD5_9CAUD|nr:Bacteriophage lambda, GpH, tail tape measure, C-terminal [uncultured Caudovirales phage]